MNIIPAVLELPLNQVFLKVRKRQRGSSQYEKLAETEQLRFYEVREGPCRFLVNFDAYLDTGLFLDHRPTRRLLGEWAADRRFLNLFAYTATATVHAALGGARTTTSVDLSRTYLEWAERNLALNEIGGSRHCLIQADCLTWLGECRDRFDLIFLDPPTFSNSKRMAGTLDIQRDHLELIRQTLHLLDSGGILVFSNNYHGFRLDRAALADLRIEDMTRRTIPPDFARHADIHHCWRIER